MNKILNYLKGSAWQLAMVAAMLSANALGFIDATEAAMGGAVAVGWAVLAVKTAAGTRIAICSEMPATFDSAGFTGTGMNWVDVAEITSAGAHGKTFAEILHKPIGTRGVQRFKGSIDGGSKTIQFGRDSNDAGQIIFFAARDSDNDYAFRVTYPVSQGETTPDIDYFKAKVMNIQVAAENVDSIVGGTAQLALSASSTGLVLVETFGA